MVHKNLMLVLFAVTFTGHVNASAYAGSDRPMNRRERYEITAYRYVRPGVSYYYVTDRRGPWRIHVLEVDLTHTELDVTSARALDKLFGREKTTSIALRHETPDRTVVAALNADFFSLATGEIENNNVIDGEFVKGTKMTETTNDTFDNIHSQFALSSDRRLFLDRFEFVGRALPGRSSPIDLFGVNDAPKSNTVVLFNRYFGPSTPTDTVKMTIDEVFLRTLRISRDTLYATVTGKTNAGGSRLDSTTSVLAGYNLSAQHALTTAVIGDTMKVWLGTNPAAGVPHTLVGGWPRIVLNGKNVGASTDAVEGTFPSFSAQRNPRSGVGFSMDSTTVYFIAVDGRQKTSAGMTLSEFADLMIAQGVYQGLNLDGGGSTTFVLEGTIMNVPSDAAGERAVGNCILLTAPKR